MMLASLSVALRRAPRRAIAGSAVLGAAFLALALLVAVGATRGVDLAVISAFQSIASYPIDVAVNAHTYVGLLPTTLLVALALMLIVGRRHGGLAWLGPAFILLTGAIELVFKLAVDHPSPPREFVRALVDLSPPIKPPHSFPSGHMARITFLTIVLASLFPSRVVFVVGGAVVALSVFARVYIGDHWISDSLGGVALGGAVALAAVAWMRATARR
jgi:membrane-associated phospholipid phosphatase